jgi:hypothetical protein
LKVRSGTYTHTCPRLSERRVLFFRLFPRALKSLAKVLRVMNEERLVDVVLLRVIGADLDDHEALGGGALIFISECSVIAYLLWGLLTQVLVGWGMGRCCWNSLF